MSKTQTQQTVGDRVGDFGRLVGPVIAALGVLTGCEAQKGPLVTGEVIRNDENAASRLVASGPGLFAPETVKVGDESASIIVRGSNGVTYYLELFDNDPSTRDSIYTQNFKGPATVSNTITALEVGTHIRFPLEVSGRKAFDESGRGRLDVDAIEIILDPSKE